MNCRVLVFAAMLAGCASAPGSLSTAPSIDDKPTAPVTAAKNPPSERRPLASGATNEEPAATPPRAEYFRSGLSKARALSLEPLIEVDEQDGIRLEFVNADVVQVVDAVIGGILEQNYAIDPQISGTITLRTPGPVTRQSVIPALEAALDPLSAVIVADAGVYAIARRPSNAAAVPVADALTRGYAAETLTLRFARPAEVRTLLQSAGFGDQVLQADQDRQQLVIAGTSQERLDIRRLAATADVDWFVGRTFAFVRVDTLAPSELLAELDQIFRGASDFLRRRVRVVPLDRLGALLAVSDSRADLRELESWVERLDVSGSSSEPDIFVYTVQYGRATDLAATLNAVLGSGGGARQRGNNAITSNDARAPQSQGLPQTPAGASRDGARIIPNETNNSLILYAPKQEAIFLIEALKELDVPQKQVLIEVLLAEVTLNDDLRYGVQWLVEAGEATFTQTQSPGGGVAPEFPGFAFVQNGSTARVALNALSSVTEVEVLSTPKLVVMNNQAATLQVGDQVPIISRVAQGVATGDAPIVNTVELRDTGVILTITPRVSDSGVVLLEIDQEVSDVAATTTSGIDSPTIQQRRISTTVSAPSGTTVAMGGLIRENATNSETGVPGLRRVPGLGKLFSGTTQNRRRTEVVILVTPRVLDWVDTGNASGDLFLESFPRARDVARSP